MIKTLQISSILAVVLAVGLFVSSVVFGVQKNEQIEQFLASAGAKEMFTEQIGKGMRTRRSNQRSPLVDRAQRFASIMNPPEPAPPKTTRQAPVAVKEAPRPEQTSAKFKLVGTSFYESNPQMSLAFIDQPGKGLYWVRQSDSVEHLVIEQVKDGVVVVRDGQRTFEMQAEERPVASSTAATSAAGSPPGRLPTTVAGRTRVDTTSRSAVSNPRSPSRLPARPDPRARTDERARLDALSSRLKALQADSKIGPSGQTDAAAEEAALLEMARKLLIESEKVGPEEAEKLGSLGKNLSSAESDPNKARPSNTRRSIPPRPRAPR